MEWQLLSFLSKGSQTRKSWKLVFVVLMRINVRYYLFMSFFIREESKSQVYRIFHVSSNEELKDTGIV